MLREEGRVVGAGGEGEGGRKETNGRRVEGGELSHPLDLGRGGGGGEVENEKRDREPYKRKPGKEEAKTLPLLP